MSIEKITSKILDEASEVKKSILDEAAQKSEAILAEAKEKAEVIVDAMEKKGLDEKEKIIQRRKSVAFIDSKKVSLNKKQEIISGCFDDAVDAIVNMERGSYIKMLVDMGASAQISEGILQFNAKEKDEIGAEVLKKLNEAAKSLYSDTFRGFKLSETVGNMKGGFIIRSGSIFIDNTIETLVAEQKISLSGELSKMLFEQDN